MNERVATRIIFFIAGMVTAIWAVIVPFAKVNTGVDDAVLGSLLLCLGAGAIVAMPLPSSLTAAVGEALAVPAVNTRKLLGLIIYWLNQSHNDGWKELPSKADFLDIVQSITGDDYIFVV